MIDSTPASVAVLAPLASSVAATCGNSHYDRARAATALGRELANLRHVDVKAVREALGDTKELENALLELVGFAYVLEPSVRLTSIAGLDSNDCGKNGVAEETKRCLTLSPSPSKTRASFVKIASRS